ncbi:MAG: ATP-dependent Clp protease adaptor protein ClpS, partial [uncultured Lysobacter sp.]
ASTDRSRTQPQRTCGDRQARSRPTAAVFRTAAERRLHPDGLRSRGSYAVFPDDSRKSHPDHAPCAHPGPRRMRCL